MHVRMLDTAAGPHFSAQPGDHKEVGEEFGAALIKGGHAVEVEAGDVPASRRERATAPKRATR